MSSVAVRSVGVAALLALGCSDPARGSGNVLFTTWGEEFIELELPPDPGDGSGFVDGWTVRFDEFLVAFRAITIANAAGDRRSMPGSILIDNKLLGVKPVFSFTGVPSGSWSSVGYEISPVDAETRRAEGVEAVQLARMLDGRYSLFVSGTASNGEREKRFAWGFATATSHERCRSEAEGRQTPGLVVPDGGSVVAELTTHGDHFFYDRLRPSADPQVATVLRFEALAEADTNDDGELTFAELQAAPIDVRRYDTSGLGVTNLAAFVTQLARTVGHFRGEGECELRAL